MIPLNKNLEYQLFSDLFEIVCTNSKEYTGRNAIGRNEVVQFSLRQRNYELLR